MLVTLIPPKPNNLQLEDFLIFHDKKGGDKVHLTKVYIEPGSLQNTFGIIDLHASEIIANGHGSLQSLMDHVLRNYSEVQIIKSNQVNFHIHLGGDPYEDNRQPKRT